MSLIVQVQLVAFELLASLISVANSPRVTRMPKTSLYAGSRARLRARPPAPIDTSC